MDELFNTLQLFSETYADSTFCKIYKVGAWLHEESTLNSKCMRIEVALRFGKKL